MLLNYGSGTFNLEVRQKEKDGYMIVSVICGLWFMNEPRCGIANAQKEKELKTDLQEVVHSVWGLEGTLK